MPGVKSPPQQKQKYATLVESVHSHASQWSGHLPPSYSSYSPPYASPQQATGSLLCSKTLFHPQRPHCQEGIRQKQYSWREFRATIHPTVLTLYATKPTPTLTWLCSPIPHPHIERTYSVAHRISFKTPGLSLGWLSWLDASFCLKYKNSQHQQVIFYFTAPTRQQALHWYHSLYARLPNPPALSPWIDIALPQEGYLRIPVARSMTMHQVFMTCQRLLQEQDMHHQRLELCWDYSSQQEQINTSKDTSDPLVGAQFISKIPHLILRPPLTHNTAMPCAIEGFLLLDQQKVYCIADQSLLFHIPPSKAMPPNAPPLQSSLWTSTASLFTPRRNVLSSTTPWISERPVDHLRRSSQLIHAESLVDLRRIERVEPDLTHRKQFRLVSSTFTVQYEADSVQSMWVWVKQLRQWLTTTARPFHVSSRIKHADTLYFRHASRSTFECVLAVLVHRLGLILFRQWQRSHRTGSKRTVYQRLCTVALQDAYLQMAMTTACSPVLDTLHRPCCYTPLPLPSAPVSDTMFVLWQPKRYRNRLAWGHGRGTQGCQYVFLATDARAKEQWAWAFHGL
ncbi:hypothetical protein BDF14DRAFT_1842259 [Spinellus fusiger]|nr:hypothetical protein BDF14DRAFT_1842259 [Spinellus fusiger]